MKQWLVLLGIFKMLSFHLKTYVPVYVLFFGTAAGSALGCVILWTGPEPLGLRLALLFIGVVCNVQIIFRKKIAVSLLYTVYVLAASALLGGVWTVVRTQAEIENWAAGLAISLLLLLGIFYIQTGKSGLQGESIYQVSFQLMGKRVTLTGYLDTGNFLTDPISHQPVSVVEEKALNAYLEEPLTKLIETHKIKEIRLIPFRSLGSEEGVMTGLFVEQMVVKQNHNVWRIDKGLIALSEVTLSGSGQYQMLLHPALINRRD